MISDDGDDRAAAPLWKFVTEIPSVFGAEVLTKLNEFEVKIFYDLCRASKEVVIRSKIELNNERRYVEKVKSMQELALAWDNYRFGEEDAHGNELTQEVFCWGVAQTNNLDFLKWVREVKRCAWDEGTMNEAAGRGNLEIIKYCVENDCPMNVFECADAALNGHLDVLKYLHEHGCPWDWRTCRCAHENNHIDCLNYAIEHECPGFEQYDPEHPDYDPPEVYSDSDEEESEESEEEEEDVGEGHPDYDSEDDIEEEFISDEKLEEYYDLEFRVFADGVGMWLVDRRLN